MCNKTRNRRGKFLQPVFISVVNCESHRFMINGKVLLPEITDGFVSYFEKKMKHVDLKPVL